MANIKKYEIDGLQVEIIGTSKVGYFASFKDKGDDKQRAEQVLWDDRNCKEYKTIKEIKKIADEMSCRVFVHTTKTFY